MSYVSTGTLPPPPSIPALLKSAFDEAAGVGDGANSTVYPALATADPGLFGLNLLTTAGESHSLGDVERRFVIMSVSKPFVFALLCSDLGAEAAGELIGLDPTGRAFNAVEAVTASPDGRTNPMVNAGAIATSSHIRADGPEGRFERIRRWMSAFAARELTIDADTYACVQTSNLRNRVITAALAERGLLGCGAEDALDLYGRQCCLEVSAADLAVMGATLANGGRNPISGDQVVAPQLCHPVLAVMLSSGMYEESGKWLYEVGLPAKSGISGGIVAVAPGKGALGVYSPPLDAVGNSVRGGLVVRSLSASLGLDLLTSEPS